MKVKRDIEQEITDQFLTTLKTGNVPWIKPWDESGEVQRFPINLISKNDYSGVNVPILWMSQFAGKHKSPYWMSFKQAKDKGGHVTKGEHGTTVIFYKMLKKDTGEVNGSGDKVINSIPLLRSYNIFNLDQIEGIEPPTALDTDDFTPVQRAERMLKGSNAKLNIYGKESHYNATTGVVTLPDRNRFKSSGDFYACALTELVHWTRAKNRCDRAPYNHGEYRMQVAFENLVAQLGSTFLMSDIQLQGNGFDGSTSTIEAWIDLMDGDKKAIFKASAQAKKAYMYIKQLYVAELFGLDLTQLETG